MIRSAGVSASPAARWLAVEADKAGRLEVNPDLSVPGYPNIFAIGDTALVVAHSRNLIGLKNAAARPTPGLAQPAIQQGKYVASLIGRRVEGQTRPAGRFGIGIKATWLSSVRTFAVADLRFLRFSGLIGWLLWAGVHIYFLIGFANAFSWASTG